MTTTGASAVPPPSPLGPRYPRCPAAASAPALVAPVNAAIPVRIILARFVEMEEAEEVLSRAMVAIIMGTRPRVTVDEVVQLLRTTFAFKDGDFTIHHHHPEDFLILFTSHASVDICIATT